MRKENNEVALVLNPSFDSFSCCAISFDDISTVHLDVI